MVSVLLAVFLFAVLLFAGSFVLVDLAAEAAGALGDFALLLSETLLIGRAVFSLALDALLLANDLVEFFDVIADSLLFALQAVGAVFAE